ncbi:MAG: M1 family peptidase [Calditrichaeota bacterium]|nr:MAG: M1 family peptidase [Calditrichota bacterium]
MKLKLGCWHFILLGSVAVNSADYSFPPPTASYNITAKLDAVDKRIDGEEEIIWINRSNRTTDEIYLHLYLNAFKNLSTTFMSEVSNRFSSLPDYFYSVCKNGWGYCDVRSIAVEAPGLFERMDVMESLQFDPIDDGNVADETVCRIRLPGAAAPGQVVHLYISFTSQLPHRAPRTGYYQDYLVAGQWFPKCGVLEEQGWNCHQYHNVSEFFADYGDYDVSITLPKNYIVGASGVLVGETSAGAGEKTVRFQEKCIHDFVWTASPKFRVAERTFEYVDLPPVKLALLYQPINQKYVDSYFDAAIATLKHLGSWYTPYPYSHLTIVDLPEKSNAGGMEYPTLFTTDVSWQVASGSQAPMGVTVHECTHQFFYGIIGNNEAEHAWMDEGLTVYATSRCLNTAYGPGNAWKMYLARDSFGLPTTFKHVHKDQRDWIVENQRERGALDFMDKPSWAYVNYPAYRNNAYEKPALMLWTLENVLGEPVFNRIMREYVTRFRFKHPKPQDFINVVNEFSPQDMNSLFDQTLHTPGVLDYAVVRVISQRDKGTKGYFGRGAELALAEKNDPGTWTSQVHLERQGDIVFPVELLITFEDGEKRRLQWDGKESIKIFSFTQKARVEKAEIDPDHNIWLDVDVTNNGRYREKNHLAAFRWGVQWLFWLQHLLETAAIFS